MSLQSSVGDRLIFSLTNNTEKPITVALATAHLPVVGIIERLNENGVTEHYLHHHSTDKLASLGYAGVTAILDDLTPAEGDGYNVPTGGTVQMLSTDPDVSIAAAIAYLKENPRYVKSVTITTNNSGFFDSGAMSFATLNPFHRENARDVNVSRYFSVNQYQQGKIVIDYAAGELQWNDNLFWAIKGIPAIDKGQACTLSFIIEFYD